MPKLVFHATDPDYAPDNKTELVSELQNSGFLGEEWLKPQSIPGERYLIGESFLTQISFMGCAPAIELAPQEAEPESTEFCHIQIEAVTAKMKFVRGSDHLISRCPHCRQRHVNWKILPDNLIYQCDKCAEEVHLADYDWRHTAGIARFFISLHGIYPEEAIPTPGLLQHLEKISGKKWSYFYIK